MIKKLILSLSVVISLVSCNSENKEKKETTTTSNASTTNTTSTDGFVIPKIDTATLKTADEIVKAHATIVDARLADEALKKSNPDAVSHYIELMEVYNAVNERRMTFGSEFKGQDYLDYNAKFKTAEDKMYGRTAAK
jgi:hypothetical protein